jgi:hypothetical protein
MRTVNVVPAPGALVTEIVPPACSTILRVIDSPSPVPWVRVVEGAEDLRESGVDPDTRVGHGGSIVRGPVGVLLLAQRRAQHQVPPSGTPAPR